MRNEIGYEVIKKAIEKLGLRHKEHISAYGEGKEQRPTGWHETADINTFKWVRGKWNNFLAATWNNFLAATHRKMSCINFITSCAIDRVLLANRRLSFMFDATQR